TNRRMMITIVVAIAQNGIIGCANKLLWHISEDLKHFKRITSGGCVIMGRKTFESIGKALPNRRNVVISRNPDFHAEGCEVYPSLDEAFVALCALDEVFIIGGGEIYRQVLPIADKIELTVVEKNFEGDTCFPTIDYSLWEVTDTERYDGGELPFKFKTLIKKLF
ncbi:MAG: dihydrofolate reductase, partial [Rikenellaceae bacterium]